MLINVPRLQSEHATVVLELDRTVKLLEIQHKLNKEYQEEVKMNYIIVSKVCISQGQSISYLLNY